MQAEAHPGTIVFFNGRYMPLRDARVGILTHALHYGTGVFEGIRAYWNPERGEMFCFRMAEHFERWFRNCGILNIDVAAAPSELCGITCELLRRNGIRADAYIRPIAYKSAERIGVCPDDEDAFALVAVPFGEYLDSEKGIHATVSSWRRVADNAIPARGKICGAYANSALATLEARRSGFDEAILLNENGCVAEGATCNLFMVRHGELITPPVYENVLEGITRDSVMQVAAREFGLEIQERPIHRSELLICDELFFTGTAVGIAPILRVNHHPVRHGAIGELTGKIRQFYADATHGRKAGYQDWLTPVYQPHAGPERDLASLAAVE